MAPNKQGALCLHLCALPHTLTPSHPHTLTDSKPHHPPPPSHPPIKQQQPPERERAKVTFDYPADNEDELTIKVGEFVEVIKKEIPDQEGWWEVSVCVCV